MAAHVYEIELIFALSSTAVDKIVCRVQPGNTVHDRRHEEAQKGMCTVTVVCFVQREIMYPSDGVIHRPIAGTLHASELFTGH